MASVRLVLLALLVAVADSAPRAGQPIMLPISTGKDGQYFVPLSIGTPPQTFLVQQSCRFCSMSTNESEQCGVSIYYSDEEQIKGVLWNDVVSMGNLSVNSTLVSFTWETPSFESRLFDGVLGLAYDSIAVGPAPTLLTSMVSAGLIQDVFSLCLGMYGGYFALGGSDTRFYRPEALVETPIAQQARYVIRTLGLHVSGTPISNRTEIYNPTVIDSSTQHVLLLPSATFALFYDVFVLKHCSPPNYLYGACQADRRQTIWAGQCFDFTDEQLAQYPTLSILFESANRGSGAVVLTLEPRDYLMEDKTGFRCLDIQPHSNPEIGGMLLGAHWMQKYYTIFNRKERRIGFAPALNCTGARYMLRQLSGNDQTGTVSSVLKKPFRVHVIDLASNASAAGVLVAWTVLRGRGVLSAAEVHTDADGVASVELTLGESAGTNMAIASVALALNSPLPFLAEGRQSVVITVFGFLTAAIVAALLLLVFFLNRRIVQSRNSAANSSLSLLMDSRRSFSPQRPERIRTDLNNSALLVAEERF